MSNDAKDLAEAVLRDHDRYGDNLSRKTIEMAIKIVDRYPSTEPRKRIIWDVNDPPKPNWDKEEE